MDFYEVLEQVVALLQRHGRVSYRALKRQFDIDDEFIEDLKDELIHSRHPITEENERSLVWTGELGENPVTPSQLDNPEPRPIVEQPQPVQPTSPSAEAHRPDAERRQLTVMFCDLVGSTHLSGQLDPEELRDVIRAYQSACNDIIQCFEGYVAQHLGDGLLIYFGYPAAHEDDAQRAVRTGLGIIEAMQTLNQNLEQSHGIQLAVRIGIHTGLVVIGDIGAGARQEQLALGETPNVAARIEGLAEANTVVISHATHQLVEGYFEDETLGERLLRGVAEPLAVYRVLRVSGIQSRLDIASTRGLTPLVGRESEVVLLLERWQQAQSGSGQVVLLRGEAGIGKSRLVQVIKEHAAATSHTRLECRSSPYYQNTALYPITDLLQRIMGWKQDDTAEAKLHKLEEALAHYNPSLEETVPLFAVLWSLPVPEERYAPLNITPQRQRQKILETLTTLLVEESERQPVLFIIEDLHWTDPSTLELLELLIEQAPTSRLYALLTCRPEFESAFGNRSYLTQMTLNRLSQPDIEHMVHRITDGKPMPGEVLQQLIEKTDGVPLYVEEMTKSVLESDVLKDVDGHYELTGSISSLSIPATLQDSLMARLDRLMTAKVVAQLGATIGRQFDYGILQAVSELDEPTLQRELGRLVDAELLYQHGLPPHATYMFKHALIQDTAYESLLRSTKQGYHRRIAQVLSEQFPETAETRPELLAYHFTEAGLSEQAVGYWYQAGLRASERSANEEAIGHLTYGIDLLETFPDTSERSQQELHALVTLGPALITTKGAAAPEVGQAYTRARDLCQQVGEPTELFTVTFGLWVNTMSMGQLETARGLAEELFGIAEQQSDPGFLLQAHHATWTILSYLEDFPAMLYHAEQGIALYNFDDHRTHAFLYAGHDPGVCSRVMVAMSRWLLGYPDQGLDNANDAIMLAEKLSHPYSLAIALNMSTWLHQYRWEPDLVLERATRAIEVCGESDSMQYLEMARILRGWALAVTSQSEDGIEEMCQGLTAFQSTGTKTRVPYYLSLLAEAYGWNGQTDQGLHILVKAIDFVAMTGERTWEAEIYRLRGELLLSQSPDHHVESEVAFQKALEVSRTQQAKSLELRAAASLAKLWQSQDKRQEAYDLLAPVYGWFTEGFDTADLIDAKALLTELAQGE